MKMNAGVICFSILLTAIFVESKLIENLSVPLKCTLEYSSGLHNDYIEFTGGYYEPPYGRNRVVKWIRCNK